MKILHLTLKKKWFDMILSGEKKEEYREIKPYWQKRFVFHYPNKIPPARPKFTHIRFVNGYGKDAPAFTIELLDIITNDNGLEQWGWTPEFGRCFVIKLGEIIVNK